MLLYTCLHLFPKKLKSKSSGQFVVKNIYLYGNIKIENPNNNVTFKVNRKILTSYLEYQPHKESTKINLSGLLNLG